MTEFGVCIGLKQLSMRMKLPFADCLSVSCANICYSGLGQCSTLVSSLIT